MSQEHLKLITCEVYYCPYCNERILHEGHAGIAEEVVCPKCNFTSAAIAFSWQPRKLEEQQTNNKA